MSHIVTIKTEVRDLTALSAACCRLQLSEPITQTVRLFSGSVFGHTVQLSGWRYPVVFEPESGQVHFDNYQGRWGEAAQLDRLLQAYAVEMAKRQARQQGHTVTEQTLTDGSIKLTVQLGAQL